MVANLHEPNRLDFNNPNSQTRKFGGKIYHVFSVQEHLSEARRIAKDIRKRGHFARIVEIERGRYLFHKKNYVVYYKFN
jgi:hypothetical protein